MTSSRAKGTASSSTSLALQELVSISSLHILEVSFDTFVTGKTFSAEATSEHVKRPLYVIGGGDLGTKASELDAALERIFDVATAWKAIILIDEVRRSTSVMRFQLC